MKINFSSLQEMHHYGEKNHLSLYAYKGCVYDLSEFIRLHPGGEVILKFANTNIEDIIFNPHYHKHSNYIIPKLQQYLMGYIEPNSQSPLKLSSAKYINKTRKILQESTIPEQDRVPDDVSIDQVPTFKPHFYSQRNIDFKR